MIPRHQEQAVVESLGDTPVVLLIGPRQVGKSTLAHHLAPRMGAATILSLDDPAIRAAAQADPNGFIARLERPAVIDEVQRVPDLLYGIKETVDRIRLTGGSADGSFLMTGSTSIWDTLRAPESLAGRIERIHMWPLSQGEVARRRERFIDSLFDDDPPRVSTESSRGTIAEMVVRGGYPEVQDRT